MPPSLMMPLFVTPQDVILRMQLPTLDGVEDTVSSGIIGAQLQVQRIVDSEFVRATRAARYFLDPDAFSGIQPQGMYRVEIASGFIRSDIPVVVTFSEDEGPFGTYEAADTTKYEVDANRGYVLLDAETFGDCFIKVQCDTGYNDGTRYLDPTGVTAYDNATTYAAGDRVSYNGKVYQCTVISVVGFVPTTTSKWDPVRVPMEQIPADLYEAVISLVPMVFNANQTTNRSDEAQKQYKTMTDHAEILLQKYVRAKGFSFRQL